MRVFLFLLLSVFVQFGISRIAFAQPCGLINHWETLIEESDSFSYRIPTTSTPNWQQLSYNASSWSKGPGGFGKGDGDDVTLLDSANYHTIYIRKTFNIVDTSQIRALMLAIDYDDGYVCYINGVEIARRNISGTPTHLSLAVNDKEAVMYNTWNGPEHVLFNKAKVKNMLVNGTNVFAVEVHQADPADDDVTLRPFVMLGMANAATTYNANLPWWFKPAGDFSTKLPVMKINTNGEEIEDDTRITADMGLIYNGAGNMNCVWDSFNNYNGKITIEIRGSTSALFPKKPYGFSTVTSTGANNNVRLLELPAESDFILLSTYNDKTFMRDYIAHDLFRKMGWYSSRTRFVELFINEEYLGIYVLMEKIKRDDNRVNIAKMTNTSNTGDAVTGGYIIKIDKFTGNNSGPGFMSSNDEIYYQFHVPKGSSITQQQQTYIENFVDTFETALSSPNFASPTQGYRKYCNPYSFIDYFIINEYSNNIDAYRLSTFLYKDRNSRCGKFTIGPLWDFNLSFGNADYCNGHPTSGWQLTDGCGDETRKYYEKMLLDPWFTQQLNCRYQELRSTYLDTAYVFHLIDSTADFLREASARDSARWNVIGYYVWPNAWVMNTWQGEIDSMKKWIYWRGLWLDNAINTTYPNNNVCAANSNISVVIDEINFNSHALNNSGDWLELYNYGNSSVNLSNFTIEQKNSRSKYCTIPAGTTLAAGQRLVICTDINAFSAIYPSVSNAIGPLCFNLSNGGEHIVLYDSARRLVHQAVFDDTLQWSKTADGYARTLQLVSTTADPTLPLSWRASCMLGTPGSAPVPCDEPIRLSEINYNSAPANNAGDWFEIYNGGTTPQNIGGTIFMLQDSSQYTVPAGTILAPGAYLVLYSDASFNLANAQPMQKLGPTGLSLSNTAGVIQHLAANGNPLATFAYNTVAPWPTMVSGTGSTIENNLLVANANEPSNWIFGCFGGSPGGPYVPCSLLNVNCSASIVAQRMNEESNYITCSTNCASDIIAYNLFRKTSNDPDRIVASSTIPVFTDITKEDAWYHVVAIRSDHTTVLSNTAYVAGNDAFAQLYPNPASKIVYVNSKSNMLYSISNIQGLKLLNGTCTAGKCAIDIASLSSGVYLVDLEAEDTNLRQQFKLIVQ